MMSTVSHTSPSGGTPGLETALGLARLALKAHGSAAPADVARDLLAALLTASAATRGALALTQQQSGTQTAPPQILAAHGIDMARVAALVTPAEERRSDHRVGTGSEWMHHMVPLGEQAPLPRDGQDGDAATAHLLLQWDGGDADGQRVRGQAAMSMLRDPIAAVLVSMLSAERQLELGRLAADRPADHLNAELLGTVSHELRSPLAAIKGYAATLLRHERRLPREERHEFLVAIEEASDRLEVIINRLLEMSQLETGTTVLHRDALDLVAIARDAINDLRVQKTTAARLRITFTLESRDLDGRVAAREPLILADARAMRALLDNLLQNAVKYSPYGGEIRVEMQPLGGDVARAALARSSSSEWPADRTPQLSMSSDAYVHVTVRDHGVGIPTEHLGRIFDRFHRVDTRLTREVDGLGIGLAICRRLVELHDGAIWAESDPGAGSAFHVLLPVATMIEQHTELKEG